MSNRPTSAFGSLRVRAKTEADPTLCNIDDEDKLKELHAYRHDAMECLVPGLHKSNNEAYGRERYFLSKTEYIYNMCEDLNIEQIAYLLCDHGIIFNMKFQRHYENRHFESLGKAGKGLPNFKEVYTEKDWLEYEAASQKYAEFCALYEVAHQCLHPKTEELASRCRNIVSHLAGSDRENDAYGIDAEMIARITQATKEYLTSGTQSKKDMPQVVDASVRRIISYITQAYIAAEKGKTASNHCCMDFRLRPFIYMVTLIIGSGKILGKDCVLSSYRAFEDETGFDAMWKKPYLVHPPKAVQRKARARLLYRLCQIMQLDDDAQRDNWALFYQLHGTFDSLDDALIILESAESESPVGKWLKCFREVSEQSDLYDYRFVPLNTLNGYRIGSVLANGGFSRFLKKFPDAVPRLAERLLSTKSDWERNVADFIDKGFTPEHDKEDVRLICEKAASNFSLSEVSGKDVDAFFCAEYEKYEGNSIDPSQAFRKARMKKNRSKARKADILELKSLLYELAMLCYYNRKALNILKQRLMIVLFK